MPDLNETTIQRFKALAGLKPQPIASGLLKEQMTPPGDPLPLELPATPSPDVGDLEPPGEVGDLEPPEDIEFEPPEDIEFEPPTGAPAMFESNTLKIMVEDQEKIVDKIADIMLKYISDK
tara:strand:+ start:436 stop:795 length:360 start_codon:yes stop_codon:yes gene_type:complete